MRTLLDLSTNAAPSELQTCNVFINILTAVNTGSAQLIHIGLL